MEHNFLIGKGIQDSDKELFFGPLIKDDSFTLLQEDAKWVDLLFNLGLFQSKGQVRKASNKWLEPIPDGWTDIVVGKLRTRICILKIFEQSEIPE